MVTGGIAGVEIVAVSHDPIFNAVMHHKITHFRDISTLRVMLLLHNSLTA